MRLRAKSVAKTLFRKTSQFGGLPDLHSFYCLACDEWHVEEGFAA
jgi:hypothetical protein